MSRYDTTEMSGMIAAKYAAQGLKDPAWKNMASKNLKSSDLSSDALNRSDDVVVFNPDELLEIICKSPDDTNDFRNKIAAYYDLENELWGGERDDIL